MPIDPHVARAVESAIDALFPTSEAGAGSIAASLPSLPGYDVLGVLGSGGMGVVYKARHLGLNRLVALKMIRAGHSAPADIQRFQDEARAAAELDHPNIVPIYEVGTHDGQHFFTMKLVEGSRLAEYVPQLLQDQRTAAQIMASVARAVHFAHQHGILHRDLKPGNILLVSGESSESPRVATPGLNQPLITDFGLAKRIEADAGVTLITDFGLAKRIEADAGVTQSGAIVGTPSYMSPEQAAGGRRRLTTATDVYSLGAVLYHLLTGRPPFRGSDTIDTLVQVCQREPAPPRKVRAGVDRDLQTICLTCLAKDPARRYQSAAALADDLDRWLEGRPIEARRTRWPTVLWKWVKRHPSASVAIGMTAAFVVAVGAGLMHIQNAAAIRQVQEAALAEREWLFTLDQARQRLRNPAVGQQDDIRRMLLETAALRGKIRDAATIATLDLQTRSLFALSLGAVELHAVEYSAEFPQHFAAVWPAALHPHQWTMAIAATDRPIGWVKGKPSEVPAGSPVDAARCIVYSPDGKYLAFAPAAGGLELWDETAGKVVATLEERGKAHPAVLAIHFNRQGKAVWACRADGQISRWTLPATGMVRAAATSVLADVRELSAACFSADSKRLVCADRQHRVLVCAVDGTGVRELYSADTTIEALAVADDGRLIAVGTQDGIVTLLDPKGRPLRQWDVSTVGVSGLIFHPSATFLLAGVRGAGTMWDVSTGEPVLRDFAEPVSLAPDGRRLAISYPVGAGANAGRVAFAELRLPQTLRSFTGHRVPVHNLTWSHNARHLVSMDTGFAIHVWEAAGGKAIATFKNNPGPEHVGNHSAVSDGERLIASAGATDAYLWQLGTDTPCEQWHFAKASLGNQLAHDAANNRFLMVRELREAGTSVLCALAPGKPEQELRVLRRAVPGETGFLHGRITADGSRYVWVGPRNPASRRRAEVYETATGRPILRVALETDSDGGEPSAGFAGKGRYLFTTGAAKRRLYDLHRPEAPPEQLPDRLDQFSADMRWQAIRADPKRSGFAGAHTLCSRADGTPWLNLPQTYSFSPDGRFLAWPDGRRIVVADLTALERQVAEFDREIKGRE